MSLPKYTRILDLRPSLLPVNVQFIVLEKGEVGERGWGLVAAVHSCMARLSAQHRRRRGQEQGRGDKWEEGGDKQLAGGRQLCSGAAAAGERRG